VFQLGIFHVEVINVVNGVPRASLCFFIFSLSFLNSFTKKKCHVLCPWCDTWHCQCHVAMQCHMLVSLWNIIGLISI